MKSEHCFSGVKVKNISTSTECSVEKIFHICLHWEVETAFIGTFVYEISLSPTADLAVYSTFMRRSGWLFHGGGYPRMVFNSSAAIIQSTKYCIRSRMDTIVSPDGVFLFPNMVLAGYEREKQGNADIFYSVVSEFRVELSLFLFSGDWLGSAGNSRNVAYNFYNDFSFLSFGSFSRLCEYTLSALGKFRFGTQCFLLPA
jgi:hypothetical protein